MNILNPVYTEKTECQDCYKCVRECPVKAVRVENGRAAVIPELCVLCGHCVTVCPAKAKHVRDDLKRTKQLVKLKKKVVASLAPSFASEFKTIEPARLVGAIKKLGFYAVSETASGADIVSASVAEDLRDAQNAAEKQSQKIFLSSACPVAVEYIKKFLPGYAPYITDRASPLLAHARFLKQTYGDDVGVVFIGPCIAKKRESDVWEEIDAAISFRDLSQWFEQERVSPETEPIENPEGSPFVPYRAAKGALYPIEGGMIDSIKAYRDLETTHMMTVTGIKGIESALSGLKNEDLDKPLFIETLACPGGCVAGPQRMNERSGAQSRIAVVDYAKNADSTLDARIDFLTGTLPANQAPQAEHTAEEIRAALRSVGKYTREDELNCGSCGYDACRSFSVAMLDGRAEKTMCVSYMRKLAQKKANGLIKAIPSGVVVADKELKIVECNQNFARLISSELAEMYEAKPGLEGADLSKIISFSRFFSDVIDRGGPDSVEREIREGSNIFHITVFSIEKGEIAGGVIQDVTTPQLRKARVVGQAKKVIDKNLSVVQKIAFLLGENAAETETMLNAIIESFGTSEKESDANER